MTPAEFERAVEAERARWEHAARRERHYARFRSEEAVRLDAQIQANIAAYWKALRNPTPETHRRVA